MRIAFLFNHDQVHQIAHSLPIALVLARAGTGAEILLVPTSARLQAEVLRLAGDAIGHGGLRMHPIELRSAIGRSVSALTDWLAPSAKLLVYRDNLEFFRSLDMLVVAEKTSLVLKRHHGLSRLRIVHTRHGAGDRAIGFDPASAGFDHVLVSGRKIRDRLIDEAGVPPDRITIVGYPKFDLFAGRPPASDGDDRPIVLYNPHPSPYLSSWYKAGRAILDWFVDHPEYRLIFAPHVMLFERKFVVTVDKLRIDRPGEIDGRYYRAENIEIDLGSRASTTMDYTERADIYLGDASSQVYEFLRRPRPCLFFDAHRSAWRDDPNFAHWTAGPVIDDVAALGPALAMAFAVHARTYAAIQRDLFSASFDLCETPSATRAAAALCRIADLTPLAPEVSRSALACA